MIIFLKYIIVLKLFWQVLLGHIPDNVSPTLLCPN